jgi:hypothetical protein
VGDQRTLTTINVLVMMVLSFGQTLLRPGPAWFINNVLYNLL